MENYEKVKCAWTNPGGVCFELNSINGYFDLSESFVEITVTGVKYPESIINRVFIDLDSQSLRSMGIKYDVIDAKRHENNSIYDDLKKAKEVTERAKQLLQITEGANEGELKIVMSLISLDQLFTQIPISVFPKLRLQIDLKSGPYDIGFDNRSYIYLAKKDAVQKNVVKVQYDSYSDMCPVYQFDWDCKKGKFC